MPQNPKIPDFMSPANFGSNFGPLRKVTWKNYAHCCKALVLEIPKHPNFLKMSKNFLVELVKFEKSDIFRR